MHKKRNKPLHCRTESQALQLLCAAGTHWLVLAHHTFEGLPHRIVKLWNLQRHTCMGICSNYTCTYAITNLLVEILCDSQLAPASVWGAPSWCLFLWLIVSGVFLCFRLWALFLEKALPRKVILWLDPPYCSCWLVSLKLAHTNTHTYWKH